MNALARRGFSIGCGWRAGSIAALLAAIGIATAPGPAAADSVSDFYRGKTISIVVGFQAGGGYDLYGRLVAQFFGRYLPGEPTVIVRNMPGAGGVQAARYLLDAAPRDGTVLGIPTQSIPFDTVLGYSAGVDAGKFNWLGRIAMNVEVGVAYASSGLNSVGDLRTREVSTGGTGGTASTTVIPFLLNKLAGTRFKLISGYRSAFEAMLAMERGEIDLVGGIGLGTVEVRFAKQLKDGSLRVLYQSGFGRHPDIPNVPNIDELGRTEEEKQMLGLYAASAAIGRSLIAPPGVPGDRIAALRQAVTAMMNDPALREFAVQHNIKLEPGSAADIDALVQKTLATPRALAERTRAVLESMKTEK